MITIQLLQDTLIDGKHFVAGESIGTSDQMAKFLISIGRAIKSIDSGIETAAMPDETEKAVQKRKRKTED
jgi:hypothetical protein